MKELKCSVGVLMTKDNWIKAFCAEYLCDDGCIIGDPCRWCLSKAERIYEYHQSKIEDAIEKTNKRRDQQIKKRMYSQEDLEEAKHYPELWEKMSIRNQLLSDLLEDKNL